MKDTTHNKVKNDSIEQTVEKSKIRTDICSQAIQWAKHQEKIGKPLATIHGATLPAENAYFENIFTHIMENFSNLNDNPHITFDCADKTRGTALKALMNLPDNCYIMHGNYSDLFTQDLKRKKNVLYAKGLATTPNKVNFAWADYCCPINTQFSHDFIHMINNNIDSGLAYVTFCGSSRAKGGRKKMLKGISKKIKDISPDTIADELVNLILANVNKNKRIKNVYRVIYGGGQKGNTTMITLGFTVNVSKSPIKVISENRQGHNKNRYNTYYQLKKVKGWKEKERKQWKRKNKVNPEKIASEKEKVRLRKKIAVRLDRGWKSDKIALDLNTNFGYSLTTGQVGSMKAWMNKEGKLAKKRVTA